MWGRRSPARRRRPQRRPGAGREICARAGPGRSGTPVLSGRGSASGGAGSPPGPARHDSEWYSTPSCAALFSHFRPRSRSGREPLTRRPAGEGVLRARPWGSGSSVVSPAAGAADDVLSGPVGASWLGRPRPEPTPPTGAAADLSSSDLTPVQHWAARRQLGTLCRSRRGHPASSRSPRRRGSRSRRRGSGRPCPRSPTDDHEAADPPRPASAATAGPTPPPRAPVHDPPVIRGPAPLSSFEDPPEREPRCTASGRPPT